MSSDVASPIDRLPADVRDLQARRRRAGRPRPRSGRGPRRRRARSTTRTGAGSRGRCRAPGSRPRPARRSAGRARARAIRSIAFGKAPTPGRTRPSAAPTRVVVVGDHGLGADPLERLLDRAQVAHPVVEDRAPVRHRSSVPLVEGTPVSSGSIETASRSARANALNRPRSCGGRWSRSACRRAGSASRSRRRRGRTPRPARRRSRRSRPAAARRRSGRTGGRRCRSRTRPAPRPSAPRRSRSGGCRRGRRAPGRAPGRARCRRPRPCGGRRSRGRRVASTDSPRRPWRPSRSSMWSRKPTPVAATTSPPSRSSSSADLGLARLALDLRRSGCSSHHRFTLARAPTRRAPGSPSARGDRRHVRGQSAAAADPRWTTGGRGA